MAAAMRGRQHLYKVDTPFQERRIPTSHEVCRSILSSRGSSCASRPGTRSDRSMRSSSVLSSALSTRDVAVLAPAGSDATPGSPPTIGMRPQRAQTKVKVRRIKQTKTEDEDGVRPDDCKRVDPVGESFIRFSMEPVPRWFYGSKANTFWGTGRDDRKLNLLRLSDFQTPPTPPKVKEPDLLAHRIPPVPKTPLRPSDFPPIESGDRVHWNSLPMEGDLDKYLRWLTVGRARQGAFTRYVGAVEPGKYRTIGEAGRPKHRK